MARMRGHNYITGFRTGDIKQQPGGAGGTVTGGDIRTGGGVDDYDNGKSRLRRKKNNTNNKQQQQLDVLQYKQGNKDNDAISTENWNQIYFPDQRNKNKNDFNNDMDPKALFLAELEGDFAATDSEPHQLNYNNRGIGRGQYNNIHYRHPTPQAADVWQFSIFFVFAVSIILVSAIFLHLVYDTHRHHLSASSSSSSSGDNHQSNNAKAGSSSTASVGGGSGVDTRKSTYKKGTTKQQHHSRIRKPKTDEWNEDCNDDGIYNVISIDGYEISLLSENIIRGGGGPAAALSTGTPPTVTTNTSINVDDVPTSSTSSNTNSASVYYLNHPQPLAVGVGLLPQHRQRFSSSVSNKEGVGGAGTVPNSSGIVLLPSSTTPSAPAFGGGVAATSSGQSIMEAIGSGILGVFNASNNNNALLSGNGIQNKTYYLNQSGNFIIGNNSNKQREEQSGVMSTTPYSNRPIINPFQLPQDSTTSPSYYNQNTLYPSNSYNETPQQTSNPYYHIGRILYAKPLSTTPSSFESLTRHPEVLTGSEQSSEGDNTSSCGDDDKIKCNMESPTKLKQLHAWEQQQQEVLLPSDHHEQFYAYERQHPYPLSYDEENNYEYSLDNNDMKATLLPRVVTKSSSHNVRYRRPRDYYQNATSDVYGGPSLTSSQLLSTTPGSDDDVDFILGLNQQSNVDNQIDHVTTKDLGNSNHNRPTNANSPIKVTTPLSSSVKANQYPFHVDIGSRNNNNNVESREQQLQATPTHDIIRDEQQVQNPHLLFNGNNNSSNTRHLRMLEILEKTPRVANGRQLILVEGEPDDADAVDLNSTGITSASIYNKIKDNANDSVIDSNKNNAMFPILEASPIIRRRIEQRSEQQASTIMQNEDVDGGLPDLYTRSTLHVQKRKHNNFSSSSNLNDKSGKEHSDHDHNNLKDNEICMLFASPPDLKKGLLDIFRSEQHQNEDNDKTPTMEEAALIAASAFPFVPNLSHVPVAPVRPPHSINIEELHLYKSYQLMETGNVSLWEARVAEESKLLKDQAFPEEASTTQSVHFQKDIILNHSDKSESRCNNEISPFEVFEEGPCNIREQIFANATDILSSSTNDTIPSNDPRKGIDHVRDDLTQYSDGINSLQRAIDFSELKLIEVIGGGGFGQVWKAVWRGTPVAVKVLTGSAQSKTVPRAVLQEFAAEINLLKGMRHPNICLYMGACLLPPNRAIITELAANGSLWDALRLPLTPPYIACDGRTRTGWPDSLYQPDSRHGAPPVFDTPLRRSSSSTLSTAVPPKGTWHWILVKRVAHGAARGMAYLHNGKPPILHRDLKSANILLDESYVAKVCDFGLSRIKAAESSMTGNCGTVQWMAPEVLSSEKYNEKADVYSYGIICWELLTAECPYEGMLPIECALAVLNKNQRPQIPRWCPPPLQALIRSCVKKDPELRPTFEQIIATLDAMP